MKKTTPLKYISCLILGVVFFVPHIILANFTVPSMNSSYQRGSATGGGTTWAQATTTGILINAQVPGNNTSFGVYFNTPTTTNGTTTAVFRLDSLSGGTPACTLNVIRQFTLNGQPSHSRISTATTTGTYTITSFNNNPQTAVGFSVGTNQTPLTTCTGELISLQFNGQNVYNYYTLPLTISQPLDMASTTQAIEIFSAQFFIWSILIMFLATIATFFSIRKR